MARLSLAMALRRLHPKSNDPKSNEAFDRVIAERKKEANRSRCSDARHHMMTMGRNVMSAARARNVRHLYSLLRPLTPRGKKMARRQTLNRKQRIEINAHFENLYKKRVMRERIDWATPEYTERPPIRDDPWTHWYISARMTAERGATLVAVRADATNPGSEAAWTEMRKFEEDGRTLPEALARAALWAIQSTPRDRRTRIYTPSGTLVTDFENIVVKKAANFADCESPKVWRQLYTEQIRRGVEIKACDDDTLVGMRRARALLNPISKTNEISEMMGEHEVIHWMGFDAGPVIEDADMRLFTGADGPPTEIEVRMAIRRLKRYAAAGADGVTTDQVRQIDIATLTDVLTEVWLSGSVPRIWRCGILIAIPKTSTQALGKNMRGITLTSQVSKVMTGIIQQRNAACGLSDEFFGFRAGRGCDAPVLLVKKAIRDAVRKGEQRFLLFVDLHKAYDNLDRDRTWDFLRRYGMGAKSVSILQSLYDDELLLDVGDGEYSVIKPRQGVRQGCCLSPMIFNIAMDAAFRTAKEKMEGITMGDQCLKMIAYADDCVLFGKTEKAVSQAWHLLYDPLIDIGMDVNAEKTKLMRVRSSAKLNRFSVGGYQHFQMITNHRGPTTGNGATKAKWGMAAGEKTLELWYPATATPERLSCPVDECGCDFTPATDIVTTPLTRLTRHLERHLKDLYVGDECMTGTRIVTYSTDEIELVEGGTIKDPRQDAKTQNVGKSNVLALFEEIDAVDFFKYLGCIIWADGHESGEVAARVKAATAAFGMVRQVCTLKNIERSVRVGVWKCIVMSVLLTGSGTWCPTETDIDTLEKTAHRHLRSILGLRTHKIEGEWDTASRERVRELAALPNFAHLLRERRLHIRRNIMCSPPESFMMALLEEHEWAPRTTNRSLDWGALTARDMVECGLTADQAELPNEWNKRCATGKKGKVIPYMDEDDDIIEAWDGRRTFWTDGSSCDKTKRAGFGILEGKWGFGTYTRGVYFRTPGKQTVNRSEIAAILWALREGRGVPIIVVSDSENALRACAGYTVKGSEDLCKAVHMEIAGRRHTATFVKVVSHPLEKKKQPNWAHWGNDVVDNLADMGRALPADECWELCTEMNEVKPAPRTLLGQKYFHKADKVCKPSYDFTTTVRSLVAAEYGRKEQAAPRNSLARLIGGLRKGGA